MESGDSIDTARQAEQSPTFVNNVRGVAAAGNLVKGGKAKMLKKTAPFAVGGLALIFIAILVVSSITAILPVSIQEMGISGLLGQVTNILDELGISELADEVAAGDVPAHVIADLNNEGVEYGTLLASGEFIPTKTEVAEDGTVRFASATLAAMVDIEEKDGQQVFKYNGKTYSAKEIVKASKKDPELYEALVNGLHIKSNFYHGSDVTQMLSDYGVARNTFVAYEPTGNEEEDQKNLEEIWVNAMNGSANADISWGGAPVSSSSYDKALGFITAIENNSTTTDSDKKNPSEAAALLNTAIAANDTQSSIRVFANLLDCIEQSKAGDNGPVNQCMNLATTEVCQDITEIKSNEVKSKCRSLTENEVFSSALGNETPTEDTAANYSNNRINLLTQNQKKSANNSSGTTGSRNGKNNSSQIAVLAKKEASGSAKSISDCSATGKCPTANLVDRSLYKDLMDSSQGDSGGGLFVLGGTALAKSFCSKLGCTVGTEKTVAEYNQGVQEIIARRAEADRATLSPFDTSSPYTFLGSLMNKLAPITTKTSSSSSSIASIFNSVASTTNDAIASLMDGSYADDNGTGGYYGQSGNCYSQQSAEHEVVGSALCVDSPVYALGSKYMEKSVDDLTKEYENLKNAKEDYVDTFSLNLTRPSSLSTGIGFDEVCKEVSGIAAQITAFFTGESCNGNVDPAIADGSAFAIQSQNDDAALISTYTLKSAVRSLMRTQTTAAEGNAILAIQNKYYEEHPIDNSPAGYIARITGMSKEDANLALDYAEYLAFLDSYDASDRYSFNSTPVRQDFTQISFDVRQIVNDYNNVIGILGSTAAFSDIRNRTYTV